MGNSKKKTRKCLVCDKAFAPWCDIHVYCSGTCRDKKIRLVKVRETFRLTPKEQELRKKIIRRWDNIK